MKTFKIIIKDYWVWSIMAWRNTGNKIKNTIQPYFDMWANIQLDFAEIENATHSFIDEIIWTFAEQDFEKTLEKIRVINANDYIKSSVRFVLADRKTPAWK